MNDQPPAHDNTRMRETLRVGAALLLVIQAACSSPSRPSDAGEPRGANTLTSAERAAGWRLLFDGSSTAGWRGYRQSGVPSGWQAIDGALTRTGAGGDLITLDQFANFELAIEWMVASGGNSGIMYRVSETADATFLTGPEFQVLDNVGHPDGASGLSSAGACYGLYPPSQDVTRPPGAWNEVRIVANGSHVEHWMNGVKIVEYEIGSPDWLERFRASPHSDAAGYGRNPRGHIAVQDHGDRVAYRNIKIRPLP
jgi:3-keto-disaccharide hydrolase